MSAHHCHAMACQTPCPPRFLMCGFHWRLVPREIAAEVYAHFNPAQCADSDDRPDPTPEWHHAANKAIAWVSWREGRMTALQAEEYVARRAR